MSMTLKVVNTLKQYRWKFTCRRTKNGSIYIDASRKGETCFIRISDHAPLKRLGWFKRPDIDISPERDTLADLRHFLTHLKRREKDQIPQVTKDSAPQKRSDLESRLSAIRKNLDALQTRSDHNSGRNNYPQNVSQLGG